MCGIAGVMRLGEAPIPGEGILARMRESIRYRGPDDDGTFRNEQVALTMVRLAIIDPAAGKQPSHGCNEASVVSVCNGEIYNYLELRETLRGHQVVDRCDTTLIPHLYEAHGTAFLQELRGMFAIALWDDRKKTLTLARDRLGIKPLYYAMTDDFLVFGSELKAILASGLVDFELDRDTLDDLFSLGWPSAPKTLIRGIKELKPGHLLEISPESKRERRWWQLAFPRPGEHREGSFKQLSKVFRAKLEETTTLHLRSDVPSGVYLSGGLDSSVIAGLVQSGASSPIDAFSLGFDEEKFDESEHSIQVSQYLGLNQHMLRMHTQTAETYPRALKHMEFPMLMPTAAPAIALAEGAKSKGIPVILSGEGADEIFGGYDGFKADKMRRFFSRPGLGFLKPLVYRQLYSWAKTPIGTTDFMLQVQGRGAESIERSFGGVYPPWYDIWQLLDLERTELLGLKSSDVRPTTEAPDGWAELLPPDVDKLDPLDALIGTDLATRLPSFILVIADRCSMAESVEVRVPFLDHQLVELAATLPPQYKMRGFTEKALLRESAKDLLPKSIVKRKKQPFTTPIRSWFFSEGSPSWVGEALSQGSVLEHGDFDPDTVTRLQKRLLMSPDRHLETLRLELVLMLVVGTHELVRELRTQSNAAGRS